MRVTALHLFLEVIGDLIGGEFAMLVRQDQLPGQMEQEVRDLVPDRSAIVVAQGLVQLEDLFDQVRPQSFPGLDPVPGAPSAEVPDHRDSTSKR
jgi:hypothetical protein